MYPEDQGGGGTDTGADYSEGIGKKITRNLEGLIPLILIIIIAAFIANKFGYLQLPFLGARQPIQALVIGEPSIEFISLLDQDRDLIYVRIRDAEALNVAPAEQLAQYDLIILDQSHSSNKAVSRQLGEAVENYVRTGGKFILIMDSGIYRSGGIYGTGRAVDVIGWEATFGDIVPVECDRGQNDVPTCSQPIRVAGRIYRQDFDHPIMQGIEQSPAHPSIPPYDMVTFRVKPTGNQVSFIKHAQFNTFYPAIVEKRLIIGKSLYFNYDPAITPGIWENTLEYLR